MSLIYLFLKLYPFFGFSMCFVCYDLAQSTRRKGMKLYAILLAGLAVFFFLTTVTWLGFRGDKNADIWFNKTSAWLQMK